MNTKRCNRCSKTKPIGKFEKVKKNGNVYRRNTCTACRSVSKRVTNYAIAKRLRLRNRKYILEIKKKGRCSVCGEEDYRTLQFHHIDPAEKEYKIAALATSACSLQKIDKEISKCVTLCANCHSIEHWKEIPDVV